MSEQIISTATIKRQAQRAAERGDLLSTCPYMPGSEAEKAWKAAYWMREVELSGEATA